MLFNDAKLEVDRANARIADLSVAVAAFLQRGAGEARVSQDKPGRYVLSVDAEPLPRDVPFMIAEAVHGMRCALDHTAREIIALAGGIPSRSACFPVRESKNDLACDLDSGDLKMAPSAVRDLIIDVIKPYKGGNEQLWALHQLHLTSKFSLLLPVVAATRLSGVCGYDERHNIFQRVALAVDSEGRVQPVSTGAKMIITDHGSVTYALVFSNDSVLASQPLVPALHMLAGAVTSTISTIKKSYLVPA